MMRTAYLQPARCSGLSLVETVISAVVVMAVLGVLVVVSGSLRADDAVQRTQEALGTLNVALLTYHSRYEQPLPRTTASAVNALRQDAATRSMLETLPLGPTPQGLMLLDGYSRPLQYRPPAPPAVIGDFVSAGPDGHFGDPQSPDPALRRATTDNLYGAERLDHNQAPQP